MSHTCSEPAFPVDIQRDSDGLIEQWYSPGLTKREYFAAKALQGLLTNPAQLATDIENQTGLAVEYADALIATLSETQPS